MKSAFHQSKEKPHGNRKYGPEEVKRWRAILRDEKISQQELAAREGVSKSTISMKLQEF